MHYITIVLQLIHRFKVIDYLLIKYHMDNEYGMIITSDILSLQNYEIV